MKCLPICLFAFVIALTAAHAEESPSDCLIRVLRTRLRGDRFLENSAYTKYYDESAAWGNLLDPLYEKRDVGLDHLKKIANEEGIFTVLPIKRPKSEKAVRDLEIQYGTKVVFAGDHVKGQPFQVLPGVALHPGNAPELSEAYRGTVNPHLGSGKVYRALDKWREYRWVDSVSKGAMPETTQATALLKESDFAEIKAIQDELKNIGKSEKANQALEKRIMKILSRLYSGSKEKFGPGNFFFKLTKEAQTGDRGELLHSGHFTTGAMARGFLIDWKRAMRGGKKFEAKVIQDRFLDYDHRESQFTYDLIFNPEKVLVQERLPIAKTPRGHPMEFRVDFIDGQPVLVNPRHSNEYLGDKGEGAARFLADFFAKQKTKLPLSGGADVVLLENGEYKILEMNFGTESGFADAHFSPVSANQIVEKITGKTPLLLIELERVFQAGVAEQRRFLQELQNKSASNYYSDVAVWFRDRYLQEWQKNPTDKGRFITAGKLHDLFKRLPNTREIYDSAETYLKVYLH